MAQRRAWSGRSVVAGAVVVLVASLLALLAVVVWRIWLRPQPSALTVVVAADIACSPDSDDFNDGEGDGDACRQMATSQLALEADPDLVLLPGDTQYGGAEIEDFEASFDPSWGRLKERTRPVPGNHEYDDDGAAGYFEYFGDAAGEPGRGYYAFEQQGWQFIGVNSNCDEVGGCDEGDEQYEWLQRTLESFDGRCQVAFWHHPRWSNGNHGDDGSTSDLYELLYAHGVDVLLSGHSHNYQRFEPLDPDRNPDHAGVRQFVVGSGGVNLKDTGDDDELAASTSEEMGVLILELQDEHYVWEFLSIGDDFTDSGSASCH